MYVPTPESVEELGLSMYLVHQTTYKDLHRQAHYQIKHFERLLKTVPTRSAISQYLYDCHALALNMAYALKKADEIAIRVRDQAEHEYDIALKNQCGPQLLLSLLEALYKMLLVAGGIALIMAGLKVLVKFMPWLPDTTELVTANTEVNLLAIMLLLLIGITALKFSSRMLRSFFLSRIRQQYDKKLHDVGLAVNAQHLAIVRAANTGARKAWRRSFNTSPPPQTRLPLLILCQHLRSEQAPPSALHEVFVEQVLQIWRRVFESVSSKLSSVKRFLVNAIHSQMR